ncbi:urotensin 2 receptor L homeolog [Xenopus laevis]|uniref:Urotensin-2 receptor n=1 Tax=Xenopus laevis TaxID=8355 RepID=Q640X3_XENLA|nr:urotensin 2 receptor L homeolog [Xenopus laevis]AAH82466.1 MGC84372 protein [Xenopus laevis]
MPFRTNLTTSVNTSGDASSSSMENMIAMCSISAVLSIMCVVGVAGNIYTLVVMCQSMKSAASMYIYIINLALADLLYLLTIPFIVGTYFIQEWYFGDIGCRILFSLDFLTMHASIFTLTIMSTERYFAVLKPLDTVKRSKSYRKCIAVVVWLVSFLITLPMLIMIKLVHKDNKSICLCALTFKSLKR